MEQEQYEYFDKNRDIVVKLIEKIPDIQDLFDKSLNTTKQCSCNNMFAVVATLLGDVYIRKNNEILCAFTIGIESDLSYVVREYYTLYKSENFPLPLANQLNNNLRTLYNYYKTVYGEDYEINHQEINKYLQENISEDLKIDLRGRKVNGKNN